MPNAVDNPIPTNYEAKFNDLIKRLGRLERRAGVVNGTITGEGQVTRAPVPTPDVVLPTDAPTEVLVVTVSGDAAGITAVAQGDVIAPSTQLEWYLDGVLRETTNSTVVRFTNDALAVPLQVDTDYTVTVRPVNVIGPGTMSLPAVGRLNPAVNAQTILGWVAIGFALIGSLQVGQITIDPDTGITIPLSTGGVIRFPADGSDAIIEAILRARSLVSENHMRIQGDDNRIEGDLRIAGGIAAPPIAPHGSNSWDHAASHLDLPVGYSSAGFGYIYGLTDDGSQWLSGRSFYSEGFIDGLDKTTGAVTTLLHETTSLWPKSYAKIGTNYYVLMFRLTDLTWWVRKYTNTWTFTGTEWQPAGADYAGQAPAMTTDGTDIWVAKMAGPLGGGTGQNRIIARKFAKDTGAQIGSAMVVNLSDERVEFTGLYVGSADFGAGRVVATTANKVYVISSTVTGTRYTASEWSLANGEQALGLAWDGTRFHTISPNDKIWHYAQHPAASSRVATSTKYDSDSTGGTHETDASPGWTYVRPPRQWLRVDVDPPGDNGGTNDPDSVRIYIDNHRQPDLGPGVTSAVYDVPDLTSAAAPTSNGFTGIGGIATFGSDAADGEGPLNDQRGDGYVRIGDFRSLTTGQRHRAKISIAADVTGIATGGAGTQMPFDQLEYQSATGFGDIANDRLVIPEDGLWILDLYLVWVDSGTTGIRDGTILINGSTFKRDRRGANGSSQTTTQITTHPIFLSAGDIITAFKLHTAGANRDITAASLAALGV